MDEHTTKPVRRRLFERGSRLLPSSSATTDKSLTALQLWGGIDHYRRSVMRQFIVVVEQPSKSSGVQVYQEPPIAA